MDATGATDQGHAHKMISRSPVSGLLWLQLGEAHGLCRQSGSWACGPKREGQGAPRPPEEVGLGARRCLGSWESRKQNHASERAQASVGPVLCSWTRAESPLPETAVVCGMR